MPATDVDFEREFEELVRDLRALPTTAPTGVRERVRALGEPDDEESADDARPGRVAMSCKRAAEQNGASAHLKPRERRRQRAGTLGALTWIKRRLHAEEHLQRVGKHQSGHDNEKPPVRFQKREAAVLEGHAKRAARSQRAGEQQRQERAQPARRGETEAEADVEDKGVHV